MMGRKMVVMYMRGVDTVAVDGGGVCGIDPVVERYRQRG